MRTILPALCIAAIVVVGCDGGSNDRTPTRTPGRATPIVTQAPEATATTRAVATQATRGETVEVQGIIGAIESATGTIDINRLQGADVRVVKVNAQTRITSARGGSLRLADLRVSDRIVARGTVERDALVASEVTVGQVVPGSNPGG